MALRDPQALIATFVRAGVLCLVSGARTCIAHGLPETPDSITATPLSPARGTAAACGTGWFLESWDATSVVFVNSIAQAQALYLRLAVEHSYIK